MDHPDAGLTISSRDLRNSRFLLQKVMAMEDGEEKVALEKRITDSCAVMIATEEEYEAVHQLILKYPPVYNYSTDVMLYPPKDKVHVIPEGNKHMFIVLDRTLEEVNNDPLDMSTNIPSAYRKN